MINKEELLQKIPKLLDELKNKKKGIGVIAIERISCRGK